jgi:serine/threonine protein kinase
MGVCTSSTAASPADPAARGNDAAGNMGKGRKGNVGGRGIVACGKRTDFGYDKDFEARYALGKLLGHGQFGYTFAAVDCHSDERVAVKRIDKNKVQRSKDISVCICLNRILVLCLVHTCHSFSCDNISWATQISLGNWIWQ